MGKVQQNYSVIESTNTFASDLLTKTSPSEGTVIVAAEQASGRGQYGSVWHASPGQNLTVSYILYPQFLLLSNQFALNMAISLGCRAAVEYCLGQEVKIKWPNDLYVGDRKIGGILIQNHILNQGIKNSIIGIGINVNETSFPEGLPNPVSMIQLAGHSFDLSMVLQALSYFLEMEYLRLKAGKYEAIHADYCRHLYGYQQNFLYCLPEQMPFEGCIQGVNADGRLLVEMNGEMKDFGFKEIQFLGPVPSQLQTNK